MSGHHVADLVVRRIVTTLERLAIFPESGRIVPERNEPDIREIIADPYRAVYRVKDGGVEIITVFRGSRSVPAGLE